MTFARMSGIVDSMYFTRSLSSSIFFRRASLSCARVGGGVATVVLLSGDGLLPRGDDGVSAESRLLLGDGLPGDSVPLLTLSFRERPIGLSALAAAVLTAAGTTLKYEINQSSSRSGVIKWR